MGKPSIMVAAYGYEIISRWLEHTWTPQCSGARAHLPSCSPVAASWITHADIPVGPADAVVGLTSQTRP